MPKTVARSLLTACALAAADAMPIVAGATEMPASVEARPTPSVVGDWFATLATGAIRLRIVLHVRAEGAGLAATMDSPDQTAAGIPVASVNLTGDRITLDVTAVSGRFEGTIDPAGGHIDGRWSQRGATLPLAFARLAAGEPLPTAVRPQMPVAPFPYAVEEVRIPNGAIGSLAGTLTRPSSAPVAAILLIAGSGPNDRDETIAGHKPFLVLADRLARAGLVVLRYDKRGVGGSDGDRRSADIPALIADARAALAFLAARPETRSLPVGILGHSEGGLVAAAIADDDTDLAFVVGLAAPGLSGRRVLPLQKRAILAARGMPEARIAEMLALDGAIFDAALAAPSSEAASDAVRTVSARSSLPPSARESIAGDVATPWMRSFLAFDPAVHFARAKAPLLALFGAKDLQVTASENVTALTAARAGRTDDRIVVLPGLNHLFQTAGSGLPDEYPDIEETQSPVVADLVVDWVAGLVAAKPGGPRP